MRLLKKKQVWKALVDPTSPQDHKRGFLYPEQPRDTSSSFKKKKTISSMFMPITPAARLFHALATDAEER
jgi:hypothetical protein